jgi:hypothetical protein
LPLRHGQKNSQISFNAKKWEKDSTGPFNDQFEPYRQLSAVARSGGWCRRVVPTGFELAPVLADAFTDCPTFFPQN